MSAMWCWLQPFGQPLIFTCIRRVSGSSICISAIRSDTARLRPIELVMPSLHESVPGQLTTSEISSAPARPPLAELQVTQCLPDLVDRSLAHPAEHQVLVHCRPGETPGVAAHDLADTAQLVRGEVALRDLDLDAGEPR